MPKLALVLATFLVAAAPAAAAPPWSPPRDASTPAMVVSAPQIAVTGSGATLFAFEFRTPVRPPEAATTVVRHVGAQGALGAQTDVRGLASIAAYGRARAIVARTTRSGRVSVAFATVDRELGAFRTLERGGREVSRPVVAANARGDAVVAWSERGRAGLRTLRVATRRAGQPFGRPRTLSARGDVPAVAVASRGEVVVAYARGRRVAARVRRPGRAFTRAQDLGPTRGVTSLDVAFGVRGTAAVVAWAEQDGGEQADENAVLRVAVKRSGAPRFTAAGAIDRATVPERAPRGPFAAIEPSGRFTVAWSSASPATPREYPVHVITGDAGGRFGAPQELTARGAVGGLVVAPDGTATVAWGALPPLQNQESNQAFAARRAPGATTFGAAEEIAARDGARDLALALDPRTAAPIAAWSGEIDHDRLQSHHAQVLRFSTRAGLTG